MKITKIEDLERGYVAVTFTPGWLGKLFGRKEVTIKYRQKGNFYIHGGGNVWLSQDGDEPSPWSDVQSALEKHRMKSEF